MGLRVNQPMASLYVWAKVPTQFTAAEFAARLIDDIGVVVTPGNAFGPSGEGFIRLSITTPTDRVEEGARRMIEWAKQNS
jgi:LL-diaminopimelate aminotransferase